MITMFSREGRQMLSCPGALTLPSGVSGVLSSGICLGLETVARPVSQSWSKSCGLGPSVGLSH